MIGGLYCGTFLLSLRVLTANINPDLLQLGILFILSIRRYLKLDSYILLLQIIISSLGIFWKRTSRTCLDHCFHEFLLIVARHPHRPSFKWRWYTGLRASISNANLIYKSLRLIEVVIIGVHILKFVVFFDSNRMSTPTRCLSRQTHLKDWPDPILFHFAHFYQPIRKGHPIVILLQWNGRCLNRTDSTFVVISDRICHIFSINVLLSNLVRISHILPWKELLRANTGQFWLTLMQWWLLLWLCSRGILIEKVLLRSWMSHCWIKGWAHFLVTLPTSTIVILVVWRLATVFVKANHFVGFVLVCLKADRIHDNVLLWILKVDHDRFGNHETLTLCCSTSSWRRGHTTCDALWIARLVESRIWIICLRNVIVLFIWFDIVIILFFL